MKQGFAFKEAYLNAFVKGSPKDPAVQKFINVAESGEIFGIRNFNFEAPLERKAELEKICYRLHEVRVYKINLG